MHERFPGLCAKQAGDSLRITGLARNKYIAGLIAICMRVYQWPAHRKQTTTSSTAIIIFRFIILADVRVIIARWDRLHQPPICKRR